MLIKGGSTTMAAIKAVAPEISVIRRLQMDFPGRSASLVIAGLDSDDATGVASVATSPASMPLVPRGWTSSVIAHHSWAMAFSLSVCRKRQILSQLFQAGVPGDRSSSLGWKKLFLAYPTTPQQK
jgi:hypothetical protein